MDGTGEKGAAGGPAWACVIFTLPGPGKPRAEGWRAWAVAAGAGERPPVSVPYKGFKSAQPSGMWRGPGGGARTLRPAPASGWPAPLEDFGVAGCGETGSRSWEEGPEARISGAFNMGGLDA